MPNTNSIDLEANSTQYGSVSDSVSLSITGNMTLEGWVKLESLPSAVGNSYTVIGKYITTAHRSYALEISSSGDRPGFGVSSNGSTATFNLANTALQTGVWNHIAAVYTAASGQCIFYLNGDPDGTSTGYPTSIFDGTAPLLIGAVDPTPLQLYDGLIDEVRISNVARSAAYIGTAYNVSVGTDASHAAYYEFNNSAEDLTSNNNDLTLVGAPVYSTDVPFGRSSSGLQNKFW